MIPTNPTQIDPNVWPSGPTRLDPNLDTGGPSQNWFQIEFIRVALDPNWDTFWVQPNPIWSSFWPWGPGLKWESGRESSTMLTIFWPHPPRVAKCGRFQYHLPLSTWTIAQRNLTGATIRFPWIAIPSLKYLQLLQVHTSFSSAWYVDCRYWYMESLSLKT